MTSPVPENIRMEDYTYELPDGKIAKYPLEDRAASKLLVYDRGNISHAPFRDIVKLTGGHGIMVLNNSKVIQARILINKPSGAGIEIFLLEPLDPAGYSEAFSASPGCRWKCMTGNKKRWKSGKLSKEFMAGGSEVTLKTLMTADHGSWQEIQFTWEPDNLPFGLVIDGAGLTPVPPYLDRSPVPEDKSWYQTVYSRFEGSVAAPTAGLHFTGDILDKLRRIGSVTGEITLHVGAGTFVPVKSETPCTHTMHAEHFSVADKTIRQIIDHAGSVTAIGTTSVRTLESLYWLGIKELTGISQVARNQFENNQKTTGSSLCRFNLSQWEYIDLPGDIPAKVALEAVLHKLAVEGEDVLEAKTEMMIIPGYQFRVTDRLITNFHQPGSTLLLLVAAFIGEDWRRVYEYALKNDFRFLSYGDSSLLIPGQTAGTNALRLKPGRSLTAPKACGFLKRTKP